MNWEVRFHEEFYSEYLAFPAAVRAEILAKVALLERFGPSLKRPHVDTLNGSTYANMKELRFSADDGVWRLAFALDPQRSAILLIAGDKAGVSERRFYQHLIKIADQRFTVHLTQLKEAREHDN
jgi:hypothetical protein